MYCSVLCFDCSPYYTLHLADTDRVPSAPITTEQHPTNVSWGRGGVQSGEGAPFLFLTPQMSHIPYFPSAHPLNTYSGCRQIVILGLAKDMTGKGLITYVWDSIFFFLWCSTKSRKLMTKFQETMGPILSKRLLHGKIFQTTEA